jgi:diguanylate cyclase (GGDEF)-like protein
MNRGRLLALVVLLSTLFAGVLRLPRVDDDIVVLLSDLGQLAASAGAAVACARAARRSRGRLRRAWWLLAAGTGSWAGGQLVWSVYEVLLDRAVPFPSLADVGFLLFPVVTTAGLLCWHTPLHGMAARTRDLLDGAIIAASLVVVSWVTALGSVVAEGGEGWLAVSLALAYPIGDVVLATLVLLALARGATHGDRAVLPLVAAGLGGLAFADSAYVYMVTVGSYTSTDLIGVGWVSGFLLVGAAALTVRSHADGAVASRRGPDAGALMARPSRRRLLLPYLPLVTAGVAVCLRLVTSGTTPLVDLCLGIVLVTLVLARQFLAMSENHRLLVALAAARDQLQHQALHDPLTGLANRTLFADRVEHALTQPGARVSLLYCDLDDFKNVNDELGHEVGDALLQVVAQRLLRCVRPADTVARLGGDEFAVLLEHHDDVAQVADRVVETVKQPCALGTTIVTTSVSVGVAEHVAGTAGATRLHAVDPGADLRVDALADDSAAAARRLLKRADAAMYAAKSAGKRRARHAGEPTSLSASSDAYGA